MNKLFSPLLLLILSGCAGLSIPAPDAPVRPLPEPPVEDSTIAVPVTISLNAILNELGLSGDEQQAGGQRKAITRGLERFLRRQAEKNENKLVQNAYARRQAARLWEVLQNPIPVGNGLSLLLGPRAVSVSPFRQQDDTIRFTIGLLARPKLVAGQIAPAPSRPLPPIAAPPSIPDAGFHIALENELSYGTLSKELSARLKESRYADKDSSVVIETIKVYGSGESLVVALDVKGTANGTVYLAGIPAYDPDSRMLFIRNLDYTLETANVLAKAADWLRHAGLQETLAGKAFWPVGDSIDSARDSLSRSLNRPLSKQVSIAGTIHDIRPVSVGVTTTGIRAVLVANGRVEMNITN